MITAGFKDCFGDKRLDKRGNQLLRDLFVKGVHSIRQLATNTAGQKGWYRFLGNDRTSEEAIAESMTSRCCRSVKGKVVLSIQDSSDINLYNHKNRIKRDDSIGTTNAPEKGLGFLIHPSLVVDAGNCFPYGFSAIRIWNRSLEKETKHDRRYNSLSIEQKESYKWIESSNQTKACLSEAAMVIIVQDREGDIYEQFATIPDKKTHLLVRSKTNRNLEEGGKLFAKLSACPTAGTYIINIAGDPRKNQIKRSARMEVRFSEVSIRKTDRAAKRVTRSVKVYAIEAKETGSSVKSPICWRLLTTVPVTTLEEALMIIEWYSWRWMIEEVFRILKEEGFNIEASELETGWSVRKMCLLMLDTIIKLFQMRIAYAIPEEDGLSSDVCFTQAESQCLQAQGKKLEGKTQKQMNPYRKKTLKSATWVIARLGGWKGYASERSPGITTLWIGLRRFYDIYNGWILAQDVSTR
jgi:Transposase DDE domain/Transposase DNA-binding